MADDINGTEVPVDDLRADLSAAFDAVEADPAPAVDKPAEVAPSAPERGQDRPRDELGRFAQKTEETAPQVASVDVKPPVAGKADKSSTEIPQLPLTPAPEQAAKPVGPPPGWSISAKSQFDALPAPVKEAIARREDEISNGFAKLAEYKGLDQYVQMARSHGKALPEVLDAYMSAENMLSSDPIRGIAELCRMYNAHPLQVARALGINPAMQQGQPQGMPRQPGMNQPQGIDPRLAAHLQALEHRTRENDARWQAWEQEQERQAQTAVDGELAEFAKNPEHKYFENVRKDMGVIMQAHVFAKQMDPSLPELDLEQAYRTACHNHPEIHEVLINESLSKRQAAQQAEAKQKATNAKRSAMGLPAGAPIPGASPGSPKSTLRDELSAAWDEAAA